MIITPFGIKSALADAKLKGSDVFMSEDTGQRLGWRLALRCLPSGSATWIFRYTHNGKRSQINIGIFPVMDIKAARRLAESYGDTYSKTTDVLGKLKADKLDEEDKINAEQAQLKAAQNQLEQQEKYTLSKLMDVYVAYLVKQKKFTSARDVASLSKHLLPLAKIPASQITKRDLVTIQRALLDAGKGRTANKLRSYVRAAYALVLRADSDATAPASALNFANEGYVESNPAALLAVAKGFNGTRDRLLTDQELVNLLARAKQSGASGLAIRAMIFLGGQRAEQLLRATVTDVQDNFLTLLDPKGKRDIPRKHPIPLEGEANNIIQEAIDLAKSRQSSFLFSTSGKKQLSLSTVSTYIKNVSEDFIKNGISVTRFQLSDLRRTIETRLAGMKVTELVRGHLASHGLGGVQNRHYDRHLYEQEKRDALKKLNRYIASKVKNNPIS